MNDLPAYILAGGRSTRFGSDKARALLDGRPLLVRIADLAKVAGSSSVHTVARERFAYDDLGVPTLADDRTDLGPVAGLEAALLRRLQHLGEGWLLLLTCDQLACEPAWVVQLRMAAGGAAHGAVWAAVFHDGQRFQPVPGLYHTRLLARVVPLLDRAEKGEVRASFQRLLDGAPVAQIPLPADWPPHLQANRPEDLPFRPSA